MTSLLLYLLKANVALLLFCGGYYLVLQKLTFYTLNRVYLIASIIVSAIYPLIDLNGYVAQHPQLQKPVQYVVLVDWNHLVVQHHQQVAPADYSTYLLYIFWLGMAVMAVRLFVQFRSLYRIHRRSETGYINEYQVRMIREDINPFSFGRNIYLNPDNHSAATLKDILKHEQVHVTGWHTMDIILGELGTLFYWFNPGIWLIKKAIAQNLEFITDKKVLDAGADFKTYQYNLLDVSFNASANTIVNHFNISTLKKRIIMMNSKKSARMSLARYIVLPVILVLVAAFTLSKARALRHIDVKAAGHSLPAKNDTTKKPVIVTDVRMNQLPKITKDTLTHKPVIVRDVKIVSPDSSVIIKDGKRLNGHPELEKDKIESMDIVADPLAKKIYPGIARGNYVLVVTSKDSKEGKAYRQKLQSQGLVPNFGSIKGSSATDTIVKMSGNAIASVIYALTDSVRKKGLKEVTVTGYPMPPDTVVETRAGAIRIVDNVRPPLDPAKEPVFVIDGVVTDQAAFNRIDPANFESISVYKDEPNTAKYGDKGKKNGVIVVTTKKKR